MKSDQSRDTLYIKPKRRNISLRNYFFRTSYISIIISILVISFISSVMLYKNAGRFAEVNNEQNLERINENAQFLVRKIESFVNDFAFNPDVQLLLWQYNNQEHPDIYNMKINFDRHWQIYASSFNNVIHNAAVFSINGDLVGSYENFLPGSKAYTYEWYDRLSSSTGEIIWLNSTIDTNSRGNRAFVVPVLKKIRSIKSQIGSDLGYLLVYLDASAISDSYSGFYSGLGLRNLIFISDDYGTIISHPDPALIGKKIFERPPVQSQRINYQGKPYKYYSTRLTRSGWNLVYLSNLNLLMKDVYLVLSISIIISLTLMVIFLLISINSARIISKPIRIIQEAFSKVEQGIFDAPIPVKTNITELDDLALRFNVMVERLETLIHENYESKLKEQILISQMKETEIETLQLQINPHFLYNTLDSINWMALSSGNAEISKMVLALGNFFRNNVSTGSIFTTVEKEIQTITHFMYIQKVRFTDKFNYTLKADETLMDLKMIRLLLQPVVENSIKHGVEPANRQCSLYISIIREKDDLLITVADDGVGMDASTLKKIKEMWNGGELKENANGSVGLVNIMKRLKLCYDRKALFAIRSKPGEGTEVCIRIPVLD